MLTDSQDIPCHWNRLVNTLDVIYKMIFTALNKTISDSPLLRVDLLKPSIHKKFFQFERNLLYRYRLMNDTWWYAIWHDPRSRLRMSEICENDRFQRLSCLPVSM